MVYQPKRTVKIKDVVLSHMLKETRYTAHRMKKSTFSRQIDADKATLKR